MPTDLQFEMRLGNGATRPLEQNGKLIIFEDCDVHLSVSCRCNLVCIINLFFIKRQPLRG